MYDAASRTALLISATVSRTSDVGAAEAAGAGAATDAGAGAATAAESVGVLTC